MFPPQPVNAIDYLVIGHITQDLTPDGPVLGGTAAYASLTASALGLKVGVVSCWAEALDLTSLEPLRFEGQFSEHTTTFENQATPHGRRQILHQLADRLDYYLVPEAWRETPIIHLGPVAREVEPSLVNRFPNAFVGATLQGWLREWDQDGLVRPSEWPEKTYVLGHLDAAVVSIEDLDYDQSRVDELVRASQLLVVTAGPEGSTVYQHGEERHIPAPVVKVVDDTGAGDIFAAVFFTHYRHTQNPWEAAELATQFAARSTTRKGLKGAPQPHEVQAFLSNVRA